FCSTARSFCSTTSRLRAPLTGRGQAKTDLPLHPSTEFPMSMFDSKLDRRHLLRVGAVSTTVSMSGWLGKLAIAAEETKTKPKRSCILLWMNGGPSTIDLWDLKTGHENGGPYKEINTTAPGLKIGEHLPKIAKHGEQLVILRGMSTKEGDHA